MGDEISIRSGLIPYYIKNNVKYFCLIKTYKDTIEFSKGHIDWTENELQCAVRECYEELKLKIDTSIYHIKSCCLVNKIKFFYVEVNETIIHHQRSFNTFKNEIKDVLWLSENEVYDKLIKWQIPVYKMVINKINDTRIKL